MIRIIKIKKHYRNGIIEHYLAILNEDAGDDYIIECVEEWCENDLHGLSYGYTYDWEIITDENIIRDVLYKKLHILNDEINARNIAMKQINDFLQKSN